MSKKSLVILGVAVVVLIGLFFSRKPVAQPLGGSDFAFSSANHATSTVGIYAWTTVLSGDSSRGYISFCNDSLAANSAIYLGLGATSTVSVAAGMTGIKIPSNTCYQM